jgi:hypothetical protein
MRGPLLSYRPGFPTTFLEQAEPMVRQRTGPSQWRPRATGVLRWPQQPLVSHREAAAQGQLPLRSVPRWRRRWATGDFSLDDAPGRGRQVAFFPPGPGSGHRRRL